jgi:hypothetical protein
VIDVTSDDDVITVDVITILSECVINVTSDHDVITDDVITRLSNFHTMTTPSPHYHKIVVTSDVNHVFTPILV